MTVGVPAPIRRMNWFRIIPVISNSNLSIHMLLVLIVSRKLTVLTNFFDVNGLARDLSHI